MDLPIEQIFAPSTGVDMVFNINSLSPYSRSSIVYDIDRKKNEIIIAQPITPFSKNTSYKELHLTTILKNKSRTIRAGVTITHLKIIDSYQLANKNTVPAVCLKYKLPASEINIRSAFRLPMSRTYIIKGKILIDQLEYHSPHDFSIRDISLAGLGIVVAKNDNTNSSPLLTLKPGQEIMMGIVLINMDQKIPSTAIPIKAEVKRVNKEYSQTHSLIGLRICGLTLEHETLLNKFIHEAQVEELKRLSGRSS